MKRRQTPSKQAILSVLASAQKALSQEDIEKNIGIEMDRVTIYRVLNRFCQDGIAHKIMADDGKYYFAICMNCNESKHLDNHFHFRCLKCQKIECLHVPVQVIVPKGYIVENVNCLLSGYCSACSNGFI
jgi:Fur family transcriptional regulator, ferric uptake regulator